MRPRILVLPIAALVISAMVWHKLSQEYPSGNAVVGAQVNVRRPAPTFEALDQENSITRLKSFLGRHELFVVFFDRESGAGGDTNLQHLKGHAEELSAAGFRVVAVSPALPQENRRFEFPAFFTIVTDPEPMYRIHRDWGCFDEQLGLPTQAVFHVDRAGNVATNDSVPIPLLESEQIDTILGFDGH